MEQTLYDILGVERIANARDLKRAYRRLARKYHPDVSDDPDGERKFKDVAEAYGTLKRPHKRTEYDSWLSSSQSPQVLTAGFGIWSSWVLWMHGWATWERAWYEAIGHPFVESDGAF